MNNYQNIYLLTHCESCYNKLGIFTGKIDSKLSEDGHKHAERLAIELKNKKIDIAFVSPLTRTKETLKHILKFHPKTKVIVDKRLIERDYGSLSRKNKEKYKKDHPDLYHVYHRSYEIVPPGGESMIEVEKRVFDFIKDLLKIVRRDHSNALVVCHGNSIRPIRKYFENLSSEQMMKLENFQHMIFKYQVSSQK